MERINYELIESPLCNIGIVRAERGKTAKIIRIFLSEEKNTIRKKIKIFFPNAEKARHSRKDPVSKNIFSYLCGKTVRFSIGEIETGLLSLFQQSVLLAASKIPYGRVATYKSLAGLIGAKSSRAIGAALAKNPFPIFLPCHRVVNSDRKIGGFQSGQILKKRLLKLEGIIFDKEGRVLKQSVWSSRARMVAALPRAFRARSAAPGWSRHSLAHFALGRKSTRTQEHK